MHHIIRLVAAFKLSIGTHLGFYTAEIGYKPKLIIENTKLNEKLFNGTCTKSTNGSADSHTAGLSESACLGR